MFTEENNKYWIGFSHLINADFNERKLWHSAQSVFNYKGYAIIFDHYTHYTVSGRVSLESFVTRIYCQFKCNENLFLNIEKPNLITKIRDFLSTKKFKTGNSAFDSRFIINSNKKNVSKLVDVSIAEKIVQSNVERLYIDNSNGIWGNPLKENHYELATYIDLYDVSYNDLLKTKNLFEAIMDNLMIKFNSEPVV